MLFTIIGITGLLNILVALESPFDENGLDDVRLTTELNQCRNSLQYLSILTDEYRTYEEQKIINQHNLIKQQTVYNSHI